MIVSQRLLTLSLFGVGAIASAACGTSELGNIESSRQTLPTEPVVKVPFDAEHRAACGEGGITAAGNEGFVRLPYLQKVTDSSAQIYWTSDSPGATSVQVTTAAGEPIATVPAISDEQSQRQSFNQYFAPLSNLEPSTMYCYSIVGKSGEWLARTGFRTAPETGANSPVRIAVIGDLGTQTTDQYKILDQLKQVPYDLVLVAGDLAYESGTLADHENNFFSVYAEIMRSVPFFVISGNHDYAADGAVFREVFALFENGGPGGVERWYSLDWGNVHIVGLDTEVITDAQSTWLDADLAATEQPWRLAFMHRPAYSAGWHGDTTKVQSKFVPLFEKHGVDLVVAGHDHNYERTHPIRDVTYAVIGSSGRGTRPVGSSNVTAYSEAVSHFGHITTTGDTLKLNAIDATGVDFDSTKIQH